MYTHVYINITYFERRRKLAIRRREPAEDIAGLELPLQLVQGVQPLPVLGVDHGQDGGALLLV